MRTDAQEWFFTLAERLERVLLRLVVLSLVALVGAQALLSYGPARSYLSYVERLEGLEVRPVVLKSNGGGTGGWKLTITLVSQPRAPRAVILLNGKEAATFAGPEVTLQVKPGDLLEVDGTLYRNPLQFRVTATAPEMSEPATGLEIVTSRSVELVGRVKGR